MSPSNFSSGFGKEMQVVEPQRPEVPYDKDHLYVFQGEYAIAHIGSRWKCIGYDDAVGTPAIIVAIGDHVLCARFENRNTLEKDVVRLVQEAWKIDMKFHSSEDYEPMKPFAAVTSQRPSIEEDQIDAIKRGLATLGIKLNLFRCDGLVFKMNSRELLPADWVEIEKYPHFEARFAAALGASKDRLTKLRRCDLGITYDFKPAPDVIHERVNWNDQQLLKGSSNTPAEEHPRFVSLVRRALKWWIQAQDPFKDSPLPI